MHLHKPAAADAQPRAPGPESQVSYNVAGCFLLSGAGERAWTVGEMWPLPFLQEDGIHGGWTLQALAPAGSTLPGTPLATGDRSFLLCSDINLAS